MVPKRDPKVDHKPDPLWGAQVLRNTRNSKDFGAFGLSEGSSFGLISGPNLGSIPGPPNSGTFQVFNSSFIRKMNSGKSDFDQSGKFTLTLQKFWSVISSVALA